MTLKGEVKALGAFTYDSMGKKLRFRSNESHPTNTSIGLDLLMFFDEVGFLLNSGMPVFTWCFFLYHMFYIATYIGVFLAGGIL